MTPGWDCWWGEGPANAGGFASGRRKTFREGELGDDDDDGDPALSPPIGRQRRRRGLTRKVEVAVGPALPDR